MNTSRRGPSTLAARRAARTSSALHDLPLVCFSHLRWSFVWQRPQHIMTRLGHVHPVYFVEEPILRDDVPGPVLEEHLSAGTTILVPILPQKPQFSAGFNGWVNPVIRELLADYFDRKLKRPDVIAWYYTPMALGALPSTLVPKASIFDAMDELGSFRHAPADLKERERSLLQTVDLLFSGGPSLHDARKHLHPRAHCFPSGVDEEHFRYPAGPAPDDLPASGSPIIGFYGVLDERIDFDLLAGIADLRPNWTIVMIGPVAKITESEMADRPNIHYMGMRSYAELPRYLARFDAAILPFALNSATRFISPTKTLEYLAGGKPVVSTPVPDVVRLYREVVQIADAPEGFVSAIERLLDLSDSEAAMRRLMARNILAEHHWDTIAAQMRLLIQEALARPALVPMPATDVVTGSTAVAQASLQGPAD